MPYAVIYVYNLTFYTCVFVYIYMYVCMCLYTCIHAYTKDSEIRNSDTVTSRFCCVPLPLPLPLPPTGNTALHQGSRGERVRASQGVDQEGVDADGHVNAALDAKRHVGVRVRGL